ncbi:thrombospondin type 3 repeat-containing protein [Kangiella sediminilitoris]|uniref:Uncharacterized protein n=1 Tax=Kangiella sediminilitoris TaxID=1144748 RepID=A0A1B3BD18_9GAMM|nr:thrombospondin type 3 repeat-containing protein [Kangiella sediminilitoris]AOE50716.1 hypothetical protein KS2013_2007 [Kangiella sediminilitoris]
MRLILYIILGLVSVSSSADTYELIYDYNYEVVDSNSFRDSPEKYRSVSIADKLYFEIIVSNADLMSESSHLAVTDGTKDGTFLVKGLENLNTKTNLLGMFSVNNKLVLLISNDGEFGRTFELWEVNPGNDIAVKVSEFPDNDGYPPFHNGVLAYYYGTEKLVLTSNQSSSIVIYDFITSDIKKIDMAAITQLTHHKTNSRNYVLGDHFYYEVSLGVGEESIYRVNLLTDEIELYTKGRMGFSHLVMGNRAYYLGTDQENNHYIYSHGEELNTVEKMISIEDYTFGNYQLKNVDNKLVYYNYGEFLVKDNQSAGFIRLSFPEGIYPHQKKAVDSYSIEKYEDKYYFIGKKVDQGRHVLIESDLKSYIEAVFYQEERDVGENPEYWSFIEFDESSESMYLVTNEDYSKQQNKMEYGSSRGYRWDIENEIFKPIWQKNNFNKVTPIHDADKSLVFAYQVETGSEAWFLDLRNGNAIQLADLNGDIRTDSNIVLVPFSTISRSLLNYVEFYDLQRYTVFSLFNDVLTGYDVPRGFFGEGIDSRYDYYSKFLTNSQGVVTLVTNFLYDSVEDNYVDLGSVVTEGTGYLDKLGLFKGRLSYLQNGTLYQRASDEDRILHYSPLYSHMITSENKMMLYGWDEENKNAEFALLNKMNIQSKFNIPCPDISSFTGLKVHFRDNIVVIESKQNSNKEIYVVELEATPKIHKIPEGTYGQPIINNYDLVKVITDNHILFSDSVIREQKQYGRYTRYSIKDGTVTEYLFEQSTNIGFKKNGKHYVGLNLGYEIATVFVLDEHLNLLASKNVHEIELSSVLDSIRFGNYLNCAYGYCYVQGWDWRADKNDPKKYFQLKFDVTLEFFEQQYSPIQALFTRWNTKNSIYFYGFSELFGKELYKHEVHGSDSDGDGIWDAYELAYGFDPNDRTDGAIDYDGDELSNFEEFDLGTSPINAHTDNDGLMDGVEINLGFLPGEYDTHLHDTDEDKLTYRQESEAGTDYLNPDTDGDGVIDGEDAFPLDESETQDNDSDGIGDNADTDDDNDGMPDDWENQYGLDPLSNSDRDTDPDDDGKTNHEEYTEGTDPTVADDNEITNPPSGDNGSGGGGSTPMWLLALLMVYSARRYYKF